MGVLDWLYKKPKSAGGKKPAGTKQHPKSAASRAGEDIADHQAITKKRADCAVKGKEYDPVTNKCR